jgi:hypothetical protein
MSKITNRYNPVLPTGRLFGRITQRGRLKSGAAGDFGGRVLADFEQKEPNWGWTLENLASLLLSYPFLCKSEKYNLPFTYKNSVLLKKPKCFQKGKVMGRPTFFSLSG